MVQPVHLHQHTLAARARKSANMVSASMVSILPRFDTWQGVSSVPPAKRPLYIYIYIYIHAHISLSIYVCIYIYIYTFTYIYIYIHAYYTYLCCNRPLQMTFGDGEPFTVEELQCSEDRIYILFGSLEGRGRIRRHPSIILLYSYIVLYGIILFNYNYHIPDDSLIGKPNLYTTTATKRGWRVSGGTTCLTLLV